MNATSDTSTMELEPTVDRSFAHDLRFIVNGQPVILHDVDPATLLVDYLRSRNVGLTGTKLSCGEGGCGACTVSLGHWDAMTGQLIERPVNACLRPLCSIDGMVVTTTEGIGNSVRKNPIQQRIVEHNGSQCGFCTPGFVMTMYCLLRRNRQPSAQDVESQFAGNLCRCTGFRPILDAMQSFVGDTAAIKAATSAPSPRNPFGPPRRLQYQSARRTWYRVLTLEQLLDLLRNLSSDPNKVKLVHGNTSIGIYKKDVTDPPVLIDISRIDTLQQCGLAADGHRLLVGGGVTYATLDERLGAWLCDRSGPETEGLRALHTTIGRIAGDQVRSVATIGGAIMLVKGHEFDGQPFPSDIFTILAALGAVVTLRLPDSPGDKLVFPILDLPRRDSFGRYPVVVSVSIPLTTRGEFVETYKVARRIQNAHAIVNAGFRIRLNDDNVVEEVRLIFGGIGAIAVATRRTEEALHGRPWDEATLARVLPVLAEEISEFLVPLPEDGMSDAYRESLATALFYKFFVHVTTLRTPERVPPRVTSAGLFVARPVSHGQIGTIPAPYFGTVGPTPPLAPPAPAALAFKAFVPKKLAALLPVAPSARHSDEHAWTLAASLAKADMPEAAAIAEKPMLKIGAELQATGEAKYTQDLQAARPALASHFVYSRVPLAHFSYSPPLPELIALVQSRFPGVRGYITFRDIIKPPPSNTFDPADPGNYDPIFARDIVTGYGQPIGLVCAETLESSAEAAAFIHDHIVYDSSGFSPAPLDIDSAVAAKSFLTGRNSLDSITRKDSDQPWLNHPVDEGSADKVFITGRQEAGGQAHFYMETQAALAVPGEPGHLTLFSSSQHLGTCQEVAANALGLPVANVDARAMRLGGGFGGKEVRPPYFAAAAAVAAWTLHSPVRLALDRNTDMNMVGKRHPFRGLYSLSATKEGVIDKLKFEFFANAGFSYDCTLPVTDLVLLSADSAYNVPTFQATRSACRTNLQTNTAMRSFGVIQCTLIVEEAIEKLAHTLGLLPETIRERNFYRDATMDAYDLTPYGQALRDCRIRQVWQSFKSAVDFDNRATAVAQFNRENRWRKRGLSMIPIKYGISYTFVTMNQASATVLVYSKDGTVLVKHGGVEMGQGIHTKIARLAADALGIDVKFIQVAGTDTSDVPNASSTGASTGTDLSGGAVWQACTDLRSRLVDACQTLGGPADWQLKWQSLWPQIVSFAYGKRVNLCSQAFFSSPIMASATTNGQIDRNERVFYYFTYSVGVSEVEIDVLTGEFTVLRSDLVYDSGKTINSLLDSGQVQGGFVQGLGNVTTEQIYYDDQGRLIPDGTWSYKIPCSKTIPIEFNVNLLDYISDPNAKTPLDTYGIHSAKSTGEPPLVLATSVFFAIKHAVRDARADAGVDDWFELESPATVERIQQACGVSVGELQM